LKEEALDRTMWRNRFGGGFGSVVRQNTEWILSVCLLGFQHAMRMLHIILCCSVACLAVLYFATLETTRFSGKQSY
jgi:hypothetical protein